MTGVGFRFAQHQPTPILLLANQVSKTRYADLALGNLALGNADAELIASKIDSKNDSKNCP
jgi:hypothetical protein